MARIRLTGKHAIGNAAYVAVDDEDLTRLSEWAWKAKPNGNGTHVYAARNVKVGGVWKLIRMHRVVIGYDGPLDIDHIDRNPLNNRRANLRVVSRSENVKNTDALLGRYVSPWPRVEKVAREPAVRPPMKLACQRCGAVVIKTGKRQLFCSEACKERSRQLPDAARRCVCCGSPFTPKRKASVACSLACRLKARYL